MSAETGEIAATLNEHQLELPFEQELKAATERSHYLSRIAAVTGKVAVRGAFALVGGAFALMGPTHHAEIAGNTVDVQFTIGKDSNASVDSTFGQLVYSNLDTLPVGVHLSSRSIDVLSLLRQYDHDSKTFTQTATADAKHEGTRIAMTAGAEMIGGMIGGAVVGETFMMAGAYLGRRERRPHEGRQRLAKASVATFATAAIIAGTGVTTFNPNFTQESQLTGTLAELKAAPNKLADLYLKDKTVAGYTKAILDLDSQINAQTEQKNEPATAYNVLMISDMHMRNMYPYLESYIQQYNVKLIINTGDEGEFDVPGELNVVPNYVDSIKEITKNTPMIWVAGNHDTPVGNEANPDEIDVLRKIPGVYVLGDKEHAGSKFTVSGQTQSVYGLNIGGLSDPRVYGGVGVYGEDDTDAVNKLEQQVVDSATQGIDKNAAIDLMLAHEPAMADALRKSYAGNIRATASGHTHAQNPNDELQGEDGRITLVEGSTGLGGLNHYSTEGMTPMEFSVLSVSQSCQFTKIVRFQLADPALATGLGDSDYGNNSSVSTYYFNPQTDVADNRTCSTDEGIQQPIDWPAAIQSGQIEAKGK